MAAYPITITLTPTQRKWLKEKLAEKGIISISKEKEERIAFFLNGPVLSKKEIKTMMGDRKKWW